MIVTDEVDSNGFELVDLNAIAESAYGDCLFFITCSAKLEERVGEKRAAIQNLFGSPKFGSC